MKLSDRCLGASRSSLVGGRLERGGEVLRPRRGARRTARSASPSRSEITWNGTGKASSSISSIEPRSAATVEDVVDELLHAWPQPLDRRRRERQADTSRRSRVWSGGSRLRIDLARPRRLAGRARRGRARGAVLGVGVLLDVAAELVAAQGAADTSS